MGYYEQAEGINKDLKDLFGSIPMKEFTERQREMLLNIFIRFGQVCKFRCRNNTAYDNFVSQCYKDIAEVKRVKADEDSEWETLRAFIGGKNGN